MPDLLQKIDQLEAKIKKLITLHQRLKADIAVLQSDNTTLTETIHKQQEEIRQLGEGNKALKLAKALQEPSEGDNNAALRQKINEMIRDIDKCLALLNK